MQEIVGILKRTENLKIKNFWFELCINNLDKLCVFKEISLSMFSFYIYVIYTIGSTLNWSEKKVNLGHVIEIAEHTIYTIIYECVLSFSQSLTHSY